MYFTMRSTGCHLFPYSAYYLFTPEHQTVRCVSRVNGTLGACRIIDRTILLRFDSWQVSLLLQSFIETYGCLWRASILLFFLRVGGMEGWMPSWSARATSGPAAHSENLNQALLEIFLALRYDFVALGVWLVRLQWHCLVSASVDRGIGLIYL